CGNRGDQLIDAFNDTPRATCTAFCDLNKEYLNHAVSKASGLIYQKQDYRELLEIKELDAVVISTPDHWHALQTVEALQAGKHVYIEKPLSLCVAEGRVMVEAATKAKKVVQVGFHRRSSNVCKEAVEMIKQGEIGEITMVRAFHSTNEYPTGIGNPTDSKPPEKWDWEKWVGPAPMRPYNENRAFYRFRWFYDYSGGQVTNMGAHYLDVIHWALGVNAPLSVAAMGGKFVIKDNREIPDTMEVIYQYPKTLVSFTQTNSNAASGTVQPGAEMEFRGPKGTLFILNKSFVILPENNYSGRLPVHTPLDRTLVRRYYSSGKTSIRGIKREGNTDTVWHTRNFVGAILTDKAPNCPIEEGHRSTTAALLANIALKQKALLEWNAETEEFTNNKEANALLKYEYREPYKFPAV
ncbi:MAG TPA: Gfo/Idh/MocA family oxidoreductase, partial [Gemmatales bacterium]|nr:Gfo/Idh/MocA family oxidoreductase [Gemmatales bacterium]